ncbi:MAG TPA: PAS domain-containing protein, partial [Archangium sp.]|uniref:sensor histidine kinase n=1 Tax=Archangium sp. TaxID=1872627 RepID=UPI002EDA645F
PGPELAWTLHTECPAPCVLFQPLRDASGSLLDYQWVSLNPAAEALLRELGLGRELSSWARALEGVPERAALGRVVDEGRPLTFELGGHPAGKARWFRAQAVKQGEGFSLWLFDETEAHEERRSLREALARERALQAREEHLRLALETAGMVAWDWSAARRSITWSSNAAGFFGRSPGQALKEFLGCVHPDDRKRVSEALEQGLLAQGPYTFQFRGLWPDGSVRCYEVVGQTFRENDAPSRMLGVVLDCTGREGAQSALREAEERYRLASWATNDLLWDWNPAGDYIHWGEASQAVLGYRPEEMGGFAWWTEQLHPEDRKMVLESLQHVVDSGGESWMGEYRFRRKDGTYAHMLDRGLVARDSKGRTSRMIGSLMDITERKRAMERMQEEARFRERFIGILGHDLRNPLTAISLLTRTLRRRGLAPPQQLLAQRIEASAARMGNMISDILDLTRARLSGGIPLSLAPASLPVVCQQVVEELSVAHPERTISFQTEGEGEGVWDAERLAQVVSNLVGNALEHGLPDGTIFVRCVGEPERQVLEISNPGAPIPAHLLGSLFDPFRQVVPGRSGRGSGLGLGLFIVRELVEAHGGQVTVRSSAQEGTTFTVVLPRDSRQSLRSGRAPEEEAHPA